MYNIQTMSIEKLHPYSDEHAVNNVVFVVEWTQPLTTDALIQACKLATKFRNLGLEQMQQQNVVEFHLPTGQVKAPSAGAGPEIGGVVFTRGGESSLPSRVVSISRTNAMVMIPDYTRWDKVWSEVQCYLKIILDEIGPSRPLSVIGLQYNDVFYWHDDPSELNLHEIFLQDSYIPKHIFQQTGFWHLHQGFLEKFKKPIDANVLHNVNVDLTESNGLRTIQILGSHRATLDEPLWQSHLKNRDSLLSMFTTLHQSNKNMLCTLLTPEVCTKIKLNAN